MEHNHSHETPKITGITKAFVVGIVLNLSYVVVQIIVGININSLSLLSDAGHNFLDVAGLALAMIAFKLSSSKSNAKYTYGYKKASILISLLNAVILLISIGSIGYEAIFRFKNIEPISGKAIAVIAIIGILINGISALMFFKDKEKDINVKSAFLHLASDALVSLGLVIGGIIIHFTNLYWIDPVLSIIICIVILISTWGLLKDSLKLSLDGVPNNVNIDNIKKQIVNTSGVKSVHHIHVWAISTTQNAMTAHLLVNEHLTNENIVTLKNKIKHELEHLNIHHTTFEIDYTNEHLEEENC